MNKLNIKWKPTGTSECTVVEELGTKEQEAEKYRLKKLEVKP